MISYRMTLSKNRNHNLVSIYSLLNRVNDLLYLSGAHVIMVIIRFPLFFSAEALAEQYSKYHPCIVLTEPPELFIIPSILLPNNLLPYLTKRNSFYGLEAIFKQCNAFVGKLNDIAKAAEVACIQVSSSICHLSSIISCLTASPRLVCDL